MAAIHWTTRDPWPAVINSSLSIDGRVVMISVATAIAHVTAATAARARMRLRTSPSAHHSTAHQNSTEHDHATARSIE